MTIAAAAGSQDGALQPTGVDDALPESMEPIWRKLNKPMQPMTIGSQGKISKSQHQSRHMFDPGHDEDDHLEEVTGDPLDKRMKTFMRPSWRILTKMRRQICPSILQLRMVIWWQYMLTISGNPVPDWTGS
ncbi:uncharacterized protein [Amphiura filiformis]|uniref:uncharacterized protein n=1 Tax=Amphiura filiformis TaxID=82378 RepID=UPI003B227887